MTRDVTIEVRGAGQQVEEQEELAYTSRGIYEKESGLHWVRYQEEIEGLQEPLEAQICFGEGQLTLDRKGEVNAHMAFVEGTASTTQYHTPFGVIEMTVYTRRVEVSEQEDRIMACVTYDMDMGGETVEGWQVLVEVASTH